MVEQEAVNFEVAGSSPVPGAKQRAKERSVFDGRGRNQGDSDCRFDYS